MSKVILTILLFLTTVCFAQNDTIYLFENFIELNGNNYNIIENEVKNGKWIEYSIDDNTFIYSLGSGKNAHFHYTIYTEYRPLKNGEYSGIELITYENPVDTINGEIIYSGNGIRIVNKIPSDKYYITGKGNYKNNKKEGKWNYLYKNGKINKDIFYKNGLPKKGYIIFRPEGTKMIEIKKVSNGDWEVIKYDESEKIISREIKNIDEFKMIY